MDEEQFYDADEEDTEGRSLADVLSEQEIDLDLGDDEYVSHILVIYGSTTIDGNERLRIAVPEHTTLTTAFGMMARAQLVLNDVDTLEV